LQYDWLVKAVGTNIGVLGIETLGKVPFRRWYCNVACISSTERFVASHDDIALSFGAKNVKLSADLNCWTRRGREWTRFDKALSCGLVDRTFNIELGRAPCPPTNGISEKHVTSRQLRPIFSEIPIAKVGRREKFCAASGSKIFFPRTPIARQPVCSQLTSHIATKNNNELD
jgi:hypothetical protein